MPQFTAEERQFRQDWFNLVETPDQWRELGRVGSAQSESRPIRVENHRTGTMGVAKPGPEKAHQDYFCRAAHEKLAYDLAYLLDLPVSPVVLWPKGAPDPYVRGRSISAWAFPQSATWQAAAAKEGVSPERMKAVQPIISAMRAFHIWIDDRDRNTSQMSIDLAAACGELRLSYYDHSHSMSCFWNSNETDITVFPAEFPLSDLREDHMIETAARIKALPKDQIENLVMRIPDPYLPNERRSSVLSNLLYRKAKLPEILSTVFRREDHGHA